jgi:hypothetical protein
MAVPVKIVACPLQILRNRRYPKRSCYLDSIVINIWAVWTLQWTAVKTWGVLTPDSEVILNGDLSFDIAYYPC